jgi:hypothetical protein
MAWILASLAPECQAKPLIEYSLVVLCQLEDLDVTDQVNTIVLTSYNTLPVSQFDRLRYPVEWKHRKQKIAEV